MLLGNANYELIQKFFETYFGKFLIVGTVWSFSFQILSEIRHIFWDLGYGFELKTSNITGLLVIFGSFFFGIFQRHLTDWPHFYVVVGPYINTVT